MESTQHTAGSTKSLVRKLAQVMGEVNHVPKNGSNTFHGYKYATEADIVAAVRKAMAARSLMMVPTVVSETWGKAPRGKGGEDRLCTLRVRFTLYDGESGEEISFEVLGEGQDPGDKATYKAMTGAVKYALLKLFLIPTGDDPEHEEEERGAQRRVRKAEARPAPRSSEPQGQPASARGPATRDSLSPGGTLVAFGPHKGKLVTDLSDAELSETIDLAHEKLGKEPKATWAPAMTANLKAIEMDLERRISKPSADSTK